MSAKTALVTGGGRGIGLAIANRFKVGGYRVAITDKVINEDVIQAFDMALEGDVADFGDAERVVKAVKNELGSIDALVNNAGITRDNLLIRMREEEFDLVLAVNLKGAFNMTRHAAPIMLKQHSGAIVNISSVAGLGGNTGQANYSASKAGLIGLTKTTAAELASRGITCNAVAPGAVETDMTRALSDEVRARMLSGIPLGRFCEAEEVADCVCFLANSPYITGEVIRIDGGMMLL
ncbi:MAG: 3-oxoacyl-ACP reductase FabG [Clostridiales bacterium]|jgi:3-oxoacyl-[acyl-carrier protein] reductase|nr:3-oxoacyl-ACP reductase FabG [Clostridiales bacterium]